MDAINLVEPDDANQRNLEWQTLYPLLVVRARTILDRVFGKHRDRLTLETHSLCHEIYIKEVNAGALNGLLDALKNGDPNKFYGCLYKAMSDVIVDYIRRRKAQMRTPPGERVSLKEADEDTAKYDVHLRTLEYIIDVNETMPELARTFALVFIEGRSIAETASILSAETGTTITPATVSKNRDFLIAKFSDLESGGR